MNAVELAEKTCTLCEVVKPLSEFHRNRRKADGHVSRCKDCVREYQREWMERQLAEDPDGFRRRRRRIVDQSRRKPEVRARGLLNTQAQRLAYTRLREAHPAEYDRLYTLAKREVGL